MPKITYSLHKKLSNDEIAHYAKVYSDGEHVENTPDADTELGANIHGKMAIDRLSKVNENYAGLIKVNLDEMSKWVLSEGNTTEHTKIMANSGNVLALDTRVYEDLLTSFDIDFAKQ